MHEHDHEHDHEHGHGHCHACENTAEETVALLKYMLEHNRHHADELHDLAHGLDGEARELVHAAVIDLENGNDKLARALKLLNGEG